MNTNLPNFNYKLQKITQQHREYYGRRITPQQYAHRKRVHTALFLEERNSSCKASLPRIVNKEQKVDTATTNTSTIRKRMEFTYIFNSAESNYGK